MCNDFNNGICRKFSGRSVFKIAFWIWLILVLLVAACFLIHILLPTKYTQINNIADYGKFTGTHDDATVAEKINCFFPSEIEDSYEIAQYSYRAENEDTYGFEAYLEIRFDDLTELERHVSEIAKPECWTVFPHNEGFAEYTLADELELWLSDDQKAAEKPYYQIEYADFRKVLYSVDELTVIYVAIGVYDGGAANTDYLSAFFNRFYLDPAEYTDMSR